jgi:hypothetical protein
MVRGGPARRNVGLKFAGGQGHVQRFGPLLDFFLAQHGLLESRHERVKCALQRLPAFFEFRHVSDAGATVEDYFVDDFPGLKKFVFSHEKDNEKKDKHGLNKNLSLERKNECREGMKKKKRRAWTGDKEIQICGIQKETIRY